MSIGKQAAMVAMQARFKGAEKALSAGRRQEAAATYRAATVDYQKGIAKPGYYIGMAGDFLTAGNCFWQLGQFRVALGAYVEGLKHAPNSLNLLTSAGFCAQRLGDLDLAVEFLKRSRELYPQNKRVNKVLHTLLNKEKDLQ